MNLVGEAFLKQICRCFFDTATPDSSYSWKFIEIMDFVSQISQIEYIQVQLDSSKDLK